jgi:hypothetical protein
MTGRSRTPAGELRKASQHHRGPPAPRKVAPAWQPGQPVSWKGRAGTFQRETGDGTHAEVTIEGRVYRVRISELI